MRPIATHETPKRLVHDANPVHTLTNIVKLQLHHRRLHSFQQMQHVSHAVVNVLVKRMYIFPALQSSSILFLLDCGRAGVRGVGLGGAFKRRFRFVLEVQFCLQFGCFFCFVLSPAFKTRGKNNVLLVVYFHANIQIHDLCTFSPTCSGVTPADTASTTRCSKNKKYNRLKRIIKSQRQQVKSSWLSERILSARK